MTTTTEKYIKKAIAEAKKEFSGHKLERVNVHMHMEADGATKILAEALEAQARANEANSQAILQLAKSLKPINACGIRITNDAIKFGDEK